ncbi:MAG: hypothetical protein RLZZ591_1797 [Pseudomonadota bacterium]
MRLWLTSGGYLMLLILGAQLGTPQGWRISAGLTALMALVAWQLVLKRARTMADTPTSSIASAAQGYVELQGRGAQFEGYPVYAPHHGLPCLWYRYKVERRHGDDWKTESQDESTTSFLIDDGTGRCTVDPEGADVLPQNSETWTQGERRYTQALILPGEQLYILGDFKTQGGDSADLNLKRDVSELLDHWKQDMPGLTQRYDRNADGQLDLQEWEQARADARHEVEHLHRDIRAQPHTHSIGLPTDGRPYLISTRSPDQLKRRFSLWAYAHAGVFLLALGGLGYVWRLG